MPAKPPYNVDDLIDQLFHEPDFEKRRYIPDKLAKIGDWKSTEALGKVLIDLSEPVLLRNECAESLGKQGDPKALDYLAQVISSEDAELRRTCIWSIGQIGLPEGIPLLKSRFGDPDVMCQRWIAKSFGRIWCQESANALLEFYNHLVQSEMLDERVLDDVLRAAGDLSPFASKKDWEPIAISVLQSSDRPISHQASLKLLNALESCPFGNNLGETIIPKLWHPLTKEGFCVLSRRCGFVDILESLWNSFKDLEVLSHLVAVEFPKAQDRFLQMCTDLPTCLAVGKGLLFANHLDTRFLSILDAFHSESLNYLQLRYEFQIRLKGDFSLVKEMFADRRLITSAIRLLEYFGDLDEGVHYLSWYAIHGEKKHVQAVVSTIGRIFSKGIVSSQLKKILQSILENERVWHIRRDARFLLRRYS